LHDRDHRLAMQPNNAAAGGEEPVRDHSKHCNAAAQSSTHIASVAWLIPDLMNPGGGAIQTRATCGFAKEEPLISVFCQQIQPVGRRSRVTGSPVRCVSDNDKRVTVVFERNAEQLAAVECSPSQRFRCWPIPEALRLVVVFCSESVRGTAVAPR
jgi:hypothetical protein